MFIFSSSFDHFMDSSVRSFRCVAICAVVLKTATWRIPENLAVFEGFENFDRFYGDGRARRLSHRVIDDGRRRVGRDGRRSIRRLHWRKWEAIFASSA